MHVNRARRKPTALNTFLEPSPNMWSSCCWNNPEKYLVNIVILDNCGSSRHHAMKRSTVSLGNSSTQLCPLTRQMSFRIKQAPAKNGATRPIGSYTFDTRYKKTKRRVELFVRVLLVPLLTTKMSLFWSRMDVVRNGVLGLGFAAPFSILRIFSGLVGLTNGWCGRWHSRSERLSTLWASLVLITKPSSSLLWRYSNTFPLIAGLL